jgi:hypothetical protein
MKKLLIIIAALVWLIVGIGVEWYEDGVYTSGDRYTDLRGANDQ